MYKFNAETTNHAFSLNWCGHTKKERILKKRPSMMNEANRKKAILEFIYEHEDFFRAVLAVLILEGFEVFGAETTVLIPSKIEDFVSFVEV